MRYTLYICMTLLLFSIGACKSSEKIVSEKDERLTRNQLIQRLANAKVPAEWMSCKGQMKLESPDLNASGSFRMHIQKDSAIWMHISKLGFEIGRALITPDSVLVINRWENTYINGSIDELSRMLGSRVSFDELQRLFWGLPLVYDSGAEIENEKDHFIVKGRDEVTKSSYLYAISAPFLITSGWLQKRNTGGGGVQSLAFTNDDFQLITDDYYFPYIRDYDLTSPDMQLKVEMSIQNLVINEAQDLHMRIPANFEPLLDSQ